MRRNLSRRVGACMAFLGSVIATAGIASFGNGVGLIDASSGGDSNWSVDLAFADPASYDHTIGGGRWSGRVATVTGDEFRCGDVVSLLLSVAADSDLSEPLSSQIVVTLPPRTDVILADLTTRVLVDDPAHTAGPSVSSSVRETDSTFVVGVNGLAPATRAVVALDAVWSCGDSIDPEPLSYIVSSATSSSDEGSSARIGDGVITLTSPQDLIASTGPTTTVAPTTTTVPTSTTTTVPTSTTTTVPTSTTTTVPTSTTTTVPTSTTTTVPTSTTTTVPTSTTTTTIPYGIGGPLGIDLYAAETIVAGLSTEIEVVVSNPSDIDALGVTVEIRSASGFLIAPPIDGEAWTCGPVDEFLRCRIDGVLAAGDSAEPIALSVAAEADLETAAAVEFVTADAVVDGATDGSSATGVLDVIEESDVDTQVVELAPILDDDDDILTRRWRVEMANEGPSTAENVRQGVTVPSELDVAVEKKPAVVDCGESGDTVTCVATKLEVPEQLAFVVTGTVAARPVTTAPSTTIVIPLGDTSTFDPIDSLVAGQNVVSSGGLLARTGAGAIGVTILGVALALAGLMMVRVGRVRR